MCNAAAAAIGLQIVGTGMQMYGAQQEGESVAQQYEAEADLYDHNAFVQDEQAKMLLAEAGFDLEKSEDAIWAGQKLVTAHRTDVKRFLGTQRTQVASSGIEVNSGTAMAIQADTEMGGEMDAITLIYNSEKQSYEHKLDAWRNQFASWEATQAAKGSRMAASDSRDAAKRARTAGAWGAAGAGIGGASRTLRSYADYEYRSG